MVRRRRSRYVLYAVLGCGLALCLVAPSPGQDRGDGQSSTRISGPLQESGLGENRTIPRSNISIDPGAIGSQPVESGVIPNQVVPRGGAISPPGDDPFPDRALDPELQPRDTLPTPGFSPLLSEDIPSALDADFSEGGPDLTPGQLDSLKSYEDRLLPAARSITDLSERSLALNRVAQSKLTGGRFDEARAALDEAAEAALLMPRGLLRDLRLIAIYRTYVELAHDRVVEAVPTISAIGSLFPGRVEEEPEDRTDSLQLSAVEFARAGELIAAMDNSNYRNEHLASLVEAQAIDSMKICNDASRAYSGREYLRDKAPELLAYADRILVQAAGQASRIDQAVWQDKAMIVLTVSASRSNQFSRATEIARGMPRAEARSEALIQLASSMARLSAKFRVGYGETIQRSWESLRAGVESAAALPPLSNADIADFGASMARQNLIDDLIFRIDAHGQNARALTSLTEELLLQLRQNQTVRRDVQSPIGDSQTLIDGVVSLRSSSNALIEALTRYRASLAERRGTRPSPIPGEREAATITTIPGPGDVVFASVQGETARIIDMLNGLALPLDRAATPTYAESARSIATIPDLAPRSNAAFSLVESLTAVGRFTDARAAARLIPDVDRRYFILARIAESQGQRGFPEEARAWIAAEVPPERRSLLYRSVEEGVLSSLDRLRSRANTAGFAGSSSGL